MSPFDILAAAASAGRRGLGSPGSSPADAYAAASQNYANATQSYQDAAAHSDSAADSFQAAADSYKATARNYRILGYAILAVAVGSGLWWLYQESEKKR